MPNNYGMRTFAIMLLVILSLGAEPPRFEAPARLGKAHIDSSVQPVSFNITASDVRIVPDYIAEKSKPITAPSYSQHPVDDFLYRNQGEYGPRTPRHDSGKFGDGFADLFDPQKPKEWLFSDHGFDCIATPISNPFLAEDPRALTELRPIFMYQRVPGEQPNFQGGSLAFFGMRASIALTDRFSVTVNKLGFVNVSADNPAIGSNFGFAEFWLGPKYTFWRDTTTGTVAAGGLIFQIPTGADATFQNTGSLTLTPYVSIGQTMQEFRQGALNGIAVAGMNFATDGERSNYFYLTGHLDFDVGNHHRFYPIAELNWFQYTKGGNRYFSGQGHDLINTGAINDNDASLMTGALGARFKITEASQVGAAFEIPILGNRDLFEYRFTIDFIFRY